MTLTLNDLWLPFMDLISSNSPNEDMARKIRAVNLGNQYLIDQMFLKSLNPYSFLSSVTDMVTVISTNYISLPSDFRKIHTIWYLSGTTYLKMDEVSIVSFSSFLEYNGVLFNDTTNTGSPNYCAITDDKIYFDKHFLAAGTADIRILYYTIPDTVVAYDRLTVDSITDFEVGETITGGTSGATATIYAIGATYLDITSSTVNGTFANPEVVTGGDSAATANTTALLSEKPQSLEWTNKYELLVPQAWATQYLALIKSSEVVDQDLILQNMIDSLAQTKNTQSVRIGLS